MTKTDLVAEVRERHTKGKYQGQEWCEHCCVPTGLHSDVAPAGWPCDATRLAVEVERRSVGLCVDTKCGGCEGCKHRAAVQEIERLREANEVLNICNAEDAKTIERLREALEFYSVKRNYWSVEVNSVESPNPIFEDHGRIARAALHTEADDERG